MYAYPIGLAFISVFVALCERLFPWRKEQRPIRSALFSDFLHLVFNGHFLGVILYGIATHHVLPPLDQWLADQGWLPMLYRAVCSAWTLPVQILVSLFVIDFMQWCVHNLLHRIPWLWTLHKTHHSVQNGEMDWIVSFRFQWTEVVVYKSLQYLPLAYFGFSSEAVLFHALFGTLIGHLNHANLNLDWGPLKYLFNSPRMHIWHHDYNGDEKSTVNFGIIFSCWDWIFRTAKIPDTPPQKIGFAGVETFPKDFLSQSAWPLSGWLPRRGTAPAAQWLARTLGVGVLALGWWFHLPPSTAAASVAAQDTQSGREPAASSQPAGAEIDFAYPHNTAEADEALRDFGAAAREMGFRDPDAMVEVDELARALGSSRLRIIDVRPNDRYQMGHIPGARSVYRPDFSVATPIPGLSQDAESLYRLLERVGVRDHDEIVLYTDGGPEAFRLWWTLRKVAGVKSRVLDGGLMGWKSRGHPLVEGGGMSVSVGRITRPDVMPVHAALWQDLAAHWRERRHVWIDARSYDEFLGTQHHKKAARAGRIPGSVHLEWTRLFRSEEDARLLPPASLRREFERLGLTKDDVVLSYCQSGTRSAATFFALYQLGYDEDRVVNYDGSWAEYSRLEHLPVEFGPPATSAR